MKNSECARLKSDDAWLIAIDGMKISNDRNKKDGASLYKSVWSGLLDGTDGYPTKDKEGFYYIANGGINGDFKATAIEFYGVKTQI